MKRFFYGFLVCVMALSLMACGSTDNTQEVESEVSDTGALGTEGSGLSDNDADSSGTPGDVATAGEMGTPGEMGGPGGDGAPGTPGEMGEPGEMGTPGEMGASGGPGGPGGQGGPGESGSGGSGGPGNSGGGPGGGGAAGVDEYTAANEYTQDENISGISLSSTGTDENAVLVQTEGISVSLDDVTISRNSQDSTGGDNSSFYGVGAATLVTDGTLSISDSTITTDAAGGAGVFAYGAGIAYVTDTAISTIKDTSGGIHVAGGGTLYAWDLDVETEGASSAAIRSDRGGGTMVVDGGIYTSGGSGSPAIYSTADITVHGATLSATGAEAICIEGLNTIRLFDSDLSGNMPDSDQNDCTWNVILYQSMSGDSEVGNSTFEMVGGTLTAKNGGMFYTTNTESTFIISGVNITNADDSEFLLRCTGNSNARGWGSTGSNGADCHFTAIDQKLEGDVIWDSISQLDFYLSSGSTLSGAFLNDESNAGGNTDGDGYSSLYIGRDSSWIVTGDSTLTNLYNGGTIVDSDGNVVSVMDDDGNIFVRGDSQYTITVSAYSDTADMSGASTLDNWSDYSIDRN